MRVSDLGRTVSKATGVSNWILLSFDAAMVVLMTVLAYYARFEGVVPEFFAEWMPILAIAGVLVYLTMFGVFGLYKVILRYIGIDSLLRLLAATGIGFALLVILNMFMPIEQDMRPVPMGVLFIQAILVLIGAAGTRLAVRAVLHLHASRSGERQRTLIVGAGSAGPLLLREIKAHPDLEMKVIGFLDDDPALLGRTIDGVPVLGAIRDLGSVVPEHGVQEIVIAMPSAPAEVTSRILEAAIAANVPASVMPQLIAARGSIRADR
ncbi:MAG: hypothetical protein M1617_04415 [Actinobacteria bacterium]|nr:hypothetical protein [Actinomycetota bacterium]MCL5887533.1 hypothetical protein [Actinomycetota bacterium]